MQLLQIRARLWMNWGRHSGGLFAMAFLVSIANGVLVVALPLRAFDLGGGYAAAGAAGGILQICYLFGCLTLGRFGTKVNYRGMVLTGTAGLTVTSYLMGNWDSLEAFLCLAGVHGLITCLLWPPVMGWVTAGSHGVELSRRLGFYNLSWSTGLVVGPFVGGWLRGQFGSEVAFTAAVAGMMCGFGCIVAMHKPPDPDSAAAGGKSIDQPLPPPQVHLFRSCARIANTFGYLGVGILRYQLPSLARFLEMDDAIYGTVVTSMSLSIACGFLVLGRTTFWHYRFGLLIGAQVLLIGAISSLWWAVEPWHLAAAVVCGGIGTSLTYYSSIYYGTAAGGPRAAAAAMHEVLLSIGFIVGSAGGGWFSEHVDLRLTYPVVAGFLVVGVGVQLFLRAVHRPPPSPTQVVMVA